MHLHFACNFLLPSENGVVTPFLSVSWSQTAPSTRLRLYIAKLALLLDEWVNQGHSSNCGQREILQAQIMSGFAWNVGMGEGLLLSK